MFLFGSQCYILLTVLAIVQSLLIGRMARTSNNSYSVATADDSPMIMSNVIHVQLLNKSQNSSGLLALWEEANDLAKANLLKTQVRT